jgi:hypothetical protein
VEFPAKITPKANIAARKALDLDPTLAHPHAILGSNEMEYDWDFAGGEAELKKAIELDPSDATAHQWYALNIGWVRADSKRPLLKPTAHMNSTRCRRSSQTWSGSLYLCRTVQRGRCSSQEGRQ